jgi:O-antigen ligase
VSFKRWIKDLGNVVMVLVILTEIDPVEAARTVLLRCTYLILPFSLVYIKYYPAQGRYYDQWTGTAYYCGVTGNKNALGMSLFVGALVLLWKITDLWSERKGRNPDKTGLLIHLLMAGLVLYLLKLAHSSTALVCSVLGASVMLAMKLPVLRSKVSRFGLYSAAAALLLFLVNTTFDLGAAFVELVGRDLTFTGRTDIWKLVLSEEINPLIGVGFYSFWMGDRVDHLSEAFFYKLNQAHNGYLETYLNTGYIGVALLLVALGMGINRVKKSVVAGSAYGALRLAFIATILFYNMTEATFDRLNLVWFVLLLALTDYTMVKKESSGPVPNPKPASNTPMMPARTSGIRLGQLRE